MTFLNSLAARWLVPAKRVLGYALTTKARQMTRGARGYRNLVRQLVPCVRLTLKRQTLRD